MGQDKVTGFMLKVFLAIILGIAVLYSIGLSHTNWVYNPEVNLTELVNIIVTNVCSFGAAWLVAKKLTEDRFNKDLKITDLKHIENQIGQIIELLVKSTSLTKEQEQEILAIFSYLERLINRFNRLYFQNDNNELKLSFYTFFCHATNFDSDGIDTQSVITEGDNLIKLVRMLIVKVNEN